MKRSHPEAKSKIRALAAAARRAARIGLLTLVAATLLIPPPSPANACGPFFSRTIFIQKVHPDLPLSDFAAGKIGILQPTYWRSFQVVAYRYFSGKPFDAHEQSQLLALWDHYNQNEATEIGGGGETGASAWASELQKIGPSIATPAAAQPGSGYARVGGPSPYTSYTNCLDDAYETAAATLHARAQEFGDKSGAVASWISAQDNVFDNCDSSAPGGNLELPPVADPSLPLQIRKDREYQIAAAYFYAGYWDEAEKRFQAIAADPTSSWRAIAALVAARCEIRAGSLGAGDSPSVTSRLTAADAQLKKILADPSLSSVHVAAWRLLGFVEIRLDPQTRLVALSQTIEKRASPETLAQDLDDYTQIMGGSSENWRLSQADFESARKSSDMTDWILTIQSPGEDGDQHALQRWQATHSIPWLVAALALADTDSPQLSQLLDAAASVPAISPAYLTVRFQRDRLLAASGKQNQARAESDEILAMPEGQLPISSRNLFLALRLSMARNLDEFLKFAPRRISLVTDDVSAQDLPNSDPCYNRQNCAATSNSPPVFDADAASQLTQFLPTQLLVKAASSPRLGEGLRRRITRAVWVRAVMLGEDDFAAKLAPEFGALSPELAAQLKEYDSAQSAAEKHVLAALIILRNPGLRPEVRAGYDDGAPVGQLDEFRDNWWCSFAPAPNAAQFEGEGGGYAMMYNHIAGPLTQLYPQGKIGYPGFLSADDQKTAAQEWKVLERQGCAPTWLGKEVVAWAKSHADDPRVPEALHLVVRASRFGCTDADTGKYSKEAFTLLHSRYPKSEWAAKTPYWFD
jgi:hypothetical protein